MNATRAGCLLAATTCLLLSACVGPIPVTPDTAGTAISTASGLLQVGKADTHQPLGIDECITRTRQAAAELGLVEVREEKHPDQLKIIYRDMRKLDITITLIRRTMTATAIHVDVGILGDDGMGRLVLWQIVRDLPNHRPIGPESQPATATSP